MTPMTPIELLGEYNRLYDENPDMAAAFVESNKDNKLFYSVIQLLERVIPAVYAQKQFMTDGITSALVEDNPKIQEALMDHVRVETSARVMDQLKKDLKEEDALG
jgi:hypothetical protein